MERTLSMAEARKKLAQLPEEFARDPEEGTVTITRHGKPVLAVMPYELFDSIMETLEIMSDPELMAALRQSLQEIARGETLPWEEVKKELLK